MQLTFTGGKELAQTLRRLPEAIATNVLAAAVMAGAGIIRDAARANCPRPGQRRRSGTLPLAESIRVRVAEKTRSYVTVTVGTGVRYAHLVEYGHQIIPRGPSRTRVSITTVRVSKRTGKQIVSTRFGLDPTEQLRLHDRRNIGATGFVAARPFLRPAFDETREAVIRKIGEVLGAGIEATVKQLASPDIETPTILAPSGLGA